MKKRLICFAFAALTITCMVGQRMPANLQKLLNAEYAINALYVDSVDEKKLVEDAIVGMLEKLDPHSAFTTAKETKELEEPLQGEFSGIGIQYNMKQDTLYVIQTIVNGPSERVGILPGDRIIFVNDTTIAGVKLKNTDIQKKLRGKKGTKVTVKVKRGSNPELITFVITRDRIPLHSAGVDGADQTIIIARAAANPGVQLIGNVALFFCVNRRGGAKREQSKSNQA